MAFNCKLNRNITLKPLTGKRGDGMACNTTNLSSGGIRQTIYLYNIADVQNLMFENDNRADDSLIIDTIISSGDYFFIDGNSIEYGEQEDSGNYTHTLNLTMANIDEVIEDILNDAVNSKYLVAFRPNGESYYRVFGWKGGATMNYSLDISDTEAAYKIELKSEGDYPLFSCYPDNFNLETKIFTPVFQPAYDIAFCEISGGAKSGYDIASYVLKVNSAGQALDNNNKLCKYSGKKQDAYRYSGVSSTGGYNIIGTYTDTGIFDGKPVKIFDPKLCPPDASGTITVNPTTFNLNSTVKTLPFSLTSSNPWKMAKTPALVTVNPASGNGNVNGNILSGGTGGQENIIFQNRTTWERVQATVNINILMVQLQMVFPNGTENFIIQPMVSGLIADYDFTVAPTGLTVNRQGNNLYCTVQNPQSAEVQQYSVTLTHVSDASERKTVNIVIAGKNIDPLWVAISQYCELS
jgi:hypothetical protein